MVASVIDAVEVDGIEWIRVQYGSDRPGDWAQYGWAPAEADIDRAGGIHVGDVYDYVEPALPPEAHHCRSQRNTPLHGVYCYGSRR